MKAVKWKRILVLVSDPFAPEQRAAAKAAAVARRCKAQVILLDAFMIPQPVAVTGHDGREELIRAVIREREARLARIASRFRFPRATECIARWGYPLHEVVIDEVQRTKPDVLIAESHRHGRVGRLLLANTDWELMRQCPCPLWFARSATLPRQPHWLVAVDPQHSHAKPTKLDDRLIQAAQRAQRQLGGNLHIVHAYESSPRPVPSALSIAATSVLKLARRRRIAPADCIVHEGETTKALTSEVERLRAHVIVMGAVSRSLGARLAIGATAERVIDRVDCDVFVVKPVGLRVPKRAPARKTHTVARHETMPAVRA